MKRKTKKRFNLPALEDELQAAYDGFNLEANEQSRTDLFITIKQLAYAVLSVAKEFKEFKDIDVISYEYALYLFERIVIKKFQPKVRYGDRFPWQVYIAKNVRHVAYNMRDNFFWRDQIKDMEFLVGEEAHFDELTEDQVQRQVEDTIQDFYREDISKQLVQALRLFYTPDDIVRLLPFCMDIIQEKKSVPIYTRDVPDDVRKFATVLISLVKRLSKPEDRFMGKNSKKLFSSALRSSVFLSTIANSKVFPKELFICLDIDSLYRLVQVAGGQTIKIPTERDLNSLLGAVVSVSKIITQGKKIPKTISEAKKEFGLVFSSGINIEDFISNIVQSLDVFEEDDSTEPIINLLIRSLSNLDQLMGIFTEAGLSSKEIAQYDYKFKRTIKALRKTLDSIERKFDEASKAQ